MLYLLSLSMCPLADGKASPELSAYSLAPCSRAIAARTQRDPEGRPVFIREPGIVHIPFSTFSSAHVALRISADLQAVWVRNSIASLVTSKESDAPILEDASRTSANVSACCYCRLYAPLCSTALMALPARLSPRMP